MGITIELYRIRIGSFIPSHAKHRTKQKTYVYSPYTQGSDIQYRVLVCTLLIGVCWVAGELLVKGLESGAINGAFDNYIFDLGTNVCGIQYDIIYYNNFHVSLPWCCSIHTLYPYFKERILLLSSDVETNPGPLSDDKNEILEAISSCKTDLLTEIRFVKTDINCIKEEISTIKQNQVSFKHDINMIKTKQSSTDKNITDLKQCVRDLEDQKELLWNDIDWLNDELSKKGDRMDNIEKNIDRLEAYSRRENTRIFGIPEDENETPLSIKENLLSYFRIASPDKEWSTRDIVRAHRIGSTTDAENDPRPIIVRFLHWDDKMSLYHGRESLRLEGIRVADDLTTRQRRVLKKLKDEGQIGYFYKGELKIREPNHSTDGSRVFVRGRRRLNPDNDDANSGGASAPPLPMDTNLPGPTFDSNDK